jgi:hypothetical protein
VTVAKSIDGIAPPPGCDYLMKVVCKKGDLYGKAPNFASGWRTESQLGSNLRLMGAGYDSTWTWAQLVRADYPGDANPFVAPIEMHQTGPAVGVAPMNLAQKSSGLFFLVSGGKDGTTGRVEYVRRTFSGYAPNVWNVSMLRYKHGLAPNGAVELYHGVGGQMIELVNAPKIGTMYEGTLNYPEIGLYRDQSGSADLVMYLAGWREYSAVAEASAWATKLAGGSTPPPPPADKFAAARAKVELFRAGSPNIAAAFDETFKALS